MMKKDLLSVTGILSASFLIASASSHSHVLIMPPNLLFYWLCAVLLLSLRVIEKKKRLRLAVLILALGGVPLAIMQLNDWKINLPFLLSLLLRFILLGFVIAWLWRVNKDERKN
ncbi:MAG: hypothetical protein LBI11_03570 [Streptococcaceae bacterium]|jgi:peptidoglycan/LPS O-acetylase OafA/YrhL|nr:hypothetical protein [Streptococcaceae bacterium]